jgi:hypothetical protein
MLAFMMYQVTSITREIRKMKTEKKIEESGREEKEGKRYKERKKGVEGRSHTHLSCMVRQKAWTRKDVEH